MIECPYCHNVVNWAMHDLDESEFSDGEEFDLYCRKCENNFWAKVEAHYYFHSRK